MLETMAASGLGVVLRVPVLSVTLYTSASISVANTKGIATAPPKLPKKALSTPFSTPSTRPKKKLS